MRLRYVNSDHAHPLWRQEGVLLVRPTMKRGTVRNQLVRLDSGRLVVAPYSNWRRAPEASREPQAESERSRAADAG